jgi:flagellar biosynthesis/type III secretory pathway M-ring protein FliF/YscJ
MTNNSTIMLPNVVGLNLRPLVLLLGLAAAVAVGVTVVLWWQGPSWNLLYSNLSDSDASGVVQALQGAGIQYKVDANGAIMVPAERVRDARLQLAGQGLPAGKSGLDLINKDPGFGVSQFMETARYQYAVENELAQTIASLQAVSAARVHLAIPQESAFVRDRSPASASVLLQLRPGQRLEAEQVSAIVHLVASSIPELDADQVTVVDQQGRLLSSPKSSEAAATAEQFEAAHRIEDGYIQRVEQLLAPLVGEGHARAQVTVDLEAGASEEAHEQYKPDSAVVRNEQDSEELSRGEGSSAGGQVTRQPLSKEQLDDVTRLVKNAVGFDESRGDSVNVVNSQFLEPTPETLTPQVVPLWQRPGVRDIARLGLGGVILLILALMVVRPLVKNIASHAVIGKIPGASAAVNEGVSDAPAPSPALAYEQQIVQARGMVSQDPKRVAQVVKTWVAES